MKQVIEIQQIDDPDDIYREALARLASRPPAEGWQATESAFRPVVSIINHTNSVVDVRFRDDGTAVVEVSQAEHYYGLVFEDGSYGIEFGLLDGSNIQRKVDLPRGGPDHIASASEADWSECLAAEWVRTARPVWSCVPKMITDHPKVTSVRVPGLLDDLGAITGIDGSIVQQCDEAQLVPVRQLGKAGLADE